MSLTGKGILTLQSPLHGTICREISQDHEMVVSDVPDMVGISSLPD